MRADFEEPVFRKTLFLAACCWLSNRALCSSLASRFRQASSSGKLRIVAVFKHISYDETPLPVRCDQYRPIDKESKRQVAGPSTIFQSDVQVAIFSHDPRCDTYRTTVVNVPCPLSVIQRGTTSCIKRAIETHTAMPHLDGLRQLQQGDAPPVLAADFVCCDKAGPNNCCEDAIYAEAPDNLLKSRMPCMAHTVSTSQCRGFNTVAADITGQIAGALLMKPAASTEGFRDCCRSVLVSSVLGIHDAPALPEVHPARVHLRSVLWLCFPGDVAGLETATRLMHLLTGDPREATFFLRVPGAQLDVELWAREVSELLVPCAIPCFPRHRWVNCLGSLSRWALLAIHDLLPRVVFMWLNCFMAQESVRDRPALHHQALAWTLSDDEEEPETKTQLAVYDPAVAKTATAAAAAENANAASAWAEFNAQQKRKCMTWIRPTGQTAPRSAAAARRPVPTSSGRSTRRQRTLGPGSPRSM